MIDYSRTLHAVKSKVDADLANNDYTDKKYTFKIKDLEVTIKVFTHIPAACSHSGLQDRRTVALTINRGKKILFYAPRWAEYWYALLSNVIACIDDHNAVNKILYEEALKHDNVRTELRVV